MDDGSSGYCVISHPISTTPIRIGLRCQKALLDVHAVLEASGYTYRNFAIAGGYLSIVGLSKAHLTAVA